MSTTHKPSGGGRSEVTAPGVRPSRDEVIARTGALAAAHELQIAAMTPREQAEAAYTPGGPTVEELEQRIRADRGLPARHARAS
jgi:hypothetical protein